MLDIGAAAAQGGGMTDSDAGEIHEALEVLGASPSFEALADAVGGQVDELLELVALAVDDLARATGGDDGASRRQPPGVMSETPRPAGAVAPRDAVSAATVQGASNGPSVGVADRPDRYLTSTAAARMLGVSRPFLVKLLDQGVIAFHRVGRDRRIAVSDVEAYLAERERAKDEFRRNAATRS